VLVWLYGCRLKRGVVEEEVWLSVIAPSLPPTPHHKKTGLVHFVPEKPPVAIKILLNVAKCRVRELFDRGTNSWWQPADRRCCRRAIWMSDAAIRHVLQCFVLLWMCYSCYFPVLYLRSPAFCWFSLSASLSTVYRRRYLISYSAAWHSDKPWTVRWRSRDALPASLLARHVKVPASAALRRSDTHE